MHPKGGSQGKACRPYVRSRAVAGMPSKLPLSARASSSLLTLRHHVLHLGLSLGMHAKGGGGVSGEGRVVHTCMPSRAGGDARLRSPHVHVCTKSCPGNQLAPWAWARASPLACPQAAGASSNLCRPGTRARWLRRKRLRLGLKWLRPPGGRFVA